MPKRSGEPPTDPNQAAHAILARLTDQAEPVAESGKDPAAVALGRRGGLKGGKARAAALSPEQRKQSAKKAAEARWGLRPPSAEIKVEREGFQPPGDGST